MEKHINPLYFKNLRHENPDEFSLRLSLPKINLSFWIHERKENILKNIKNIFITFITTRSLWTIDAHVVRSFFNLTFLYLLFHNRRHFELDKADCLLKDYLLRSAGSMCSSCHGFEETTPERWDTRNLKRDLYSPVQQKHGGRIIPRKI